MIDKITNQSTNTAASGQSELIDWVAGYSEEERYLHEILTLIKEQYARAAQPYVNRLAEIHAMRLIAKVARRTIS